MKCEYCHRPDCPTLPGHGHRQTGVDLYRLYRGAEMDCRKATKLRADIAQETIEQLTHWIAERDHECGACFSSTCLGCHPLDDVDDYNFNFQLAVQICELCENRAKEALCSRQSGPAANN